MYNVRDSLTWRHKITQDGLKRKNESINRLGLKCVPFSQVSKYSLASPIMWQLCNKNKIVQSDIRGVIKKYLDKSFLILKI